MTKNRMVWRWFVPALTTTCVVSILLFVSYGRRHPLDAGPMLQDVGTNAATVVWWSNRADSTTLTLLTSDGEHKLLQARREGTRFEVRIAGLRPATEYAYWIEIENNNSEKLQIPGKLRTAPLPGTPLSFFVFGDSGSGKRAQYRLAAVMSLYQADLVLHTGDLVYRKGKMEDYYRKFHRPYRELLTVAPFYPVLGNHDIHTDNGRPFLDTFSLPMNGPPSIESERCYWFDYGDARFVAVDSTLTANDLEHAVVPWLTETLLNSPLTWKIVFFHEPPWAGAYRPPNAKTRDILVPAIEVAGTDVVFCGHNHLYERTHPIREGRVSPDNGVLYIITGAGGKSLYKEIYGDAAHIAAYNNKKYSFTLVNMDRNKLDISQISENNKVLDSYTLRKTMNRDGGAIHK